MPADQPTTDDPAESPGSDDPDPSRSEDPAPGLPNGIEIDLVLNTPEPDPPITGWLDDQLARVAVLAGVTNANLSLAVVEDAEMAELHEQYTGVAGTTDVLTFDLGEQMAGDPPAGPASPITGLDGDIILCLDEAKRQAGQRSHPLRHELLLYAVHGLLHLLGEDDHDEAAYQRMHAREDELLRAIGLGPVFDPSADPPAH